MRLHYQTYQAYLALPLYRIARSVAINRARGVCEECKINPVTEVHHIQYPFWGTFDTPSNLLAVCHECHCKKENKDN
jgi:hypothetical protein